MKIIGFTASPRKKGNTAWAVSKILEGAEEQGAETQSWHFSDLDIKPCHSCFGCKNGDKGCVINDDMQKLYSAILAADALVLGSPVYMGQMSAQAKIFTDRLYAYFSPRFSPYFKKIPQKKGWSLYLLKATLIKIYSDYILIIPKKCFSFWNLTSKMYISFQGCAMNLRMKEKICTVL
jgi:multimeric flavodoxin WrbA